MEPSVQHSPPHPGPVAPPFSQLLTDCRVQRPHRRSTTESHVYNGSHTGASGLTAWSRIPFCEIAGERKVLRFQHWNHAPMHTPMPLARLSPPRSIRGNAMQIRTIEVSEYPGLLLRSAMDRSRSPCPVQWLPEQSQLALLLLPGGSGSEAEGGPVSPRRSISPWIAALARHPGTPASAPSFQWAIWWGCRHWCCPAGSRRTCPSRSR
jgi:hypothetical protein